MGRVLVDEHDALVVFVEEVRAAQLEQRWNGDVLEGVHRAAVVAVSVLEQRGRRKDVCREGRQRWRIFLRPLRRVPHPCAGADERRAIQDSERTPYRTLDGALDL